MLGCGFVHGNLCHGVVHDNALVVFMAVIHGGVHGGGGGGGGPAWKGAPPLSSHKVR